MEIEDIKNEASKIKWYHRIDLGHGIVTNGINQPILERIGIPNDLRGKTVLDISAWDGFYSFEAEKRGAGRILATDSFVWKNKTWGSKAGFELARRVLKSKVEDMTIDIMEISPEKTGTFDLVLFLGVLYHLRHPLLALEKVYSVTNEMAIIETTTDLQNIKRPAMAFYPENELNADPSNWFGLNNAAIESMLKVVGFKKIKLFYESPKEYREDGKKGSSKIWRPKKIPHTRVTFHAWK